MSDDTQDRRRRRPRRRRRRPAEVRSAPGPGAGADLHRAADGRARRHHRQHRPAVHRPGPRHQRHQPDLDRHRLHAGLRRLPAPRRPARRPLRPAQDLHDRPRGLCRGIAARWSRAERAAAADRPWPPGLRCRAGLPRGAGADHHHVPGRSGAQPRVRDLRRHVRCRRGRRPDPRRLAHRLQPRPAGPRHPRLAADLPDQRADRHRRGPAGAALPPRVREPPRPARHPRCDHRHRRPARDRLRPHPRRQPGVRLERPLDDHQPDRRSCAARAVRRGRVARGAPAAAVPDLRQPDQGRELRGDGPAAGGDVRDVLLPEPVHPERDGLQPAQDRRRVPAVQHRHRDQRGHRVQPGQPHRRPLHRRRRHADRRRARSTGSPGSTSPTATAASSRRC